MTPRDAEKIVVAALVWNQARAHRLAIGTEKRRADAAYRSLPFGVVDVDARQRAWAAAERLTLARREELAAARALSKVCPRQAGHLPMADVVVTIPPDTPCQPLP